MRNRIERLRLWLLAGALLLLAVLAVFIGSARYLRRHALARLTSKLGIDIKSETNGFTYSQSLQGRTIYTIHAAKEIEHRDGRITLHDVSMVLYGRTGDRADMVYGKDFEYDQSAGIVRALGLVHIDLGAAGSGKPGAPPLKPLADGEHDPGGGPRLLHATTSGLVYVNKLGVAATSEAIEFETGTMKGHAVGADYSTDTGILLLHSDVTMSGVANKRPVDLAAATAQLDERGRRAILTRARYVSDGQTMEAAQATLHTRPDNSLERVEAQGNVTLGASGGTVSAARADVALADKSKLQTAFLTGGVHYTQQTPLRQAHGEAQQARIAFNPDGEPQHALFAGAVHLVERTRIKDDPRQPWGTRDLIADTVDTDIVQTPSGQSSLREAEATGHARLILADNSTAAAPAHTNTTELSGDALKAHLLPAAAAKQPARVDSIAVRGHAVLHQVTSEGLEQTTESDTLDAIFKPAPPNNARSTSAQPGDAASATAGERLASAAQEGHVRITRRTPAKSGAASSVAQVEQATAQHATYDGEADRVNLTGGARLSNAASLLLADHVVLDRVTGNAQAEGSVKVSYLQEPSPAPSTGAPAPRPAEREPIHILADRAQLDHASDTTTFFGRPVRVWQGGSQIQAPVVELARTQRQMSAHAATANGATHAVRAILPGTESPSANSTTAASPIQIDSGVLVYSDLTHQAQFTGGVRIANASETITAREAIGFLQPAAPATSQRAAARPAPGKPSSGSSAISLDGRIDRVVATGAIVVDQPGLHATGDRLVYTAAERLVTLTGTPADLPRVVDTRRGTAVTAPAFRFHINDQSVEALGTAPGEVPGAQRVLADTPVRR